MGLPTGQQRILEMIEGRLAESDPRLVSLFKIFTRLTFAEAMPWIEQLRVRPLRDRLSRFVHWIARILTRPLFGRVQLKVLLPATLAAVACTLTIAFSFTGSQKPVTGQKTSAGSQLVINKHRNGCRMGSLVRFPALTC